jgi:hypothetical protein
MQAAWNKLPDKVYAKESIPFTPETPLRIKKFSETTILENIVF